MFEIWDSQQIEDHIKANELLMEVYEEIITFLKSGVSEWDVNSFVLELYKRYGLKTNRNQIIAFLKAVRMPKFPQPGHQVISALVSLIILTSPLIS